MKIPLKKWGKLIYESDSKLHKKERKRVGYTALLTFLLFIITFVAGNYQAGGLNINRPADRVFLFGISFIWYLFIESFYRFLVLRPIQIYENGFVWVTGRFIYYKDIKKVELEYIQKIMEEKKYTGIKIKIKGWLLPRIIGFDDPSVIPFIRYVLPRIKKHGGKIMFTKEELKRVLEKYKVNASFIDEVSIWDEKRGNI